MKFAARSRPPASTDRVCTVKRGSLLEQLEATGLTLEAVRETLPPDADEPAWIEELDADRQSNSAARADQPRGDRRVRIRVGTQTVPRSTACRS